MFIFDPLYFPEGASPYQVAVEGTITNCKILFPEHGYHHGKDLPFNLYTIELRMEHDQTESELEQLVEVLRHKHLQEMSELDRLEWDNYPEDQKFEHPHFIKGHYLYFQSKFPPKLSGSFRDFTRDQEFIEQYAKILFTIQFQKDMNVFMTASSVDPFPQPHERRWDENDGHTDEDDFVI